MKILKQCKKAISASGDGGNVVIVDIVINVLGDDPKKTETGLFFDILMMIASAEESATRANGKIFSLNLGSRTTKFTPMEGTYSIIELFP